MRTKTEILNRIDYNNKIINIYNNEIKNESFYIGTKLIMLQYENQLLNWVLGKIELENNKIPNYK